MKSRRPIVILEDNDDDLFFLKRRLAAGGVENPVVHFTSGEDAVECFVQLGKAAEDEQPCLFLTDLAAHGASGLEVMAAIRQMTAFRDLTIIVISGTDDPSRLDRAAKLSNGIYRKFPDVETIKRLVENACG